MSALKCMQSEMEEKEMHGVFLFKQKGTSPVT